MYQHFNPLAMTDAWWQHILMLVVAAVLGYIIGYRSRKSQIEDLEATLGSLDGDLDDCLQSKKVAMSARMAATPVVPPTPDDLKVVEGIGPVIEKLFNNAGIWTFAQLANTAPERLREILLAGGTRFQIHDPGTWPDQAAMARDGKWDELKQWQDELNKGREE
ncbi:MAG: hypothetical protein MUE30_04410 [Spirosomaceae bacterium]|jgi:hypothetical protein|nr:hypothetical protein [Spirosomataceae bacterium]